MRPPSGPSRGISTYTSDIAHVFGMTQRQVQRLMKQWCEDGNIVPVLKPGHPSTAQRVCTQRMIADKVARDPVQTVKDLCRESGTSRTTGGRVVKELGLRSRAGER